MKSDTASSQSQIDSALRAARRAGLKAREIKQLTKRVRAAREKKENIKNAVMNWGRRELANHIEKHSFCLHEQDNLLQMAQKLVAAIRETVPPPGGTYWRERDQDMLTDDEFPCPPDETGAGAMLVLWSRENGTNPIQPTEAAWLMASEQLVQVGADNDLTRAVKKLATAIRVRILRSARNNVCPGCCKKIESDSVQCSGRLRDANRFWLRKSRVTA